MFRPRHLIPTSMLALLLWPLPKIVTHVSPARTILGRYEPLYFTFLVGYCGGTLVWAAATIWLTTRSDAQKRQIKQQLDLHYRHWATTAYALMTLVFIAFRLMHQWRVISFPPQISRLMAMTSWGFYLLAIAGISLAAANKPAFMPQTLGWIQRIKRRRWTGPLIWVGILGICVLMLLLTIGQDYWVYPLNGDASAHVYIGQVMTYGKIPYRDFAALQPPMRHLVTWLWAVVAQWVGVSAVIVGRIFTLAAGASILVLVGVSGYALTRSYAAALLPPAILLGLSPFTDALLNGPNLKITMISVVLLALCLAQHQKWLWAGFAAGLATLWWLPAGGYALSILIIAIIQPGETRKRALVHTALGGLIILGLNVVVLLVLGALSDAVNQIGGGTWLYLMGSNNTAGLSGAKPVNLFLNQFAIKVHNRVKGDELLLGIVGAGTFLTIWPWTREVKLHDPVKGIPVLAGAISLLLLLIDFQGSQDLLIGLAVFSISSATIIPAIKSLLESNVPPEYAHCAMEATVSVLLATIVVVGLYNTPHNTVKHYIIAFPQQQEMASELDRLLATEDSVIALNELWFPVLANRPNPTSFAWYGDLIGKAMVQRGLTQEHIKETIEREQPVILMMSPSPLASDIAAQPWLMGNYVLVKTLTSDSNPIRVYVLTSRSDLLEVVESWPEG